MATVKSYTDIEQSKKLAEILPLESADMSYTWDFDDEQYYISMEKFSNWRVPKYAESSKHKQVIPCWSLAALLELLPKRIEIVDNVYELSTYLYGIYYWNIINGNLCFKSKDKDNFVDTCYEAIVFLHEQKLL